MTKVFFSNKTIYLISNRMDYQQQDDTVLVTIYSLDELQVVYDELLNKNESIDVYLYYENEKRLLTAFSALFKPINAAGGLVKNTKGEFLFIFRNGKWDLPKGKIEKGEGIETAAIREVEEECGIGQLKIVTELASTYHIYFIENKAILKRTHWFEMSSNDLSPLVPQITEGITDVQWLPKTALKQVYDNTFPSIIDVMNTIV
jgi:8-oxo-dGTP pyrophosphatase MutT (NUDIX family)